MTGFYRWNGQPKPARDFCNAEILKIPEEDNQAIFFREPRYRGAQLARGFIVLAFD